MKIQDMTVGNRERKKTMISQVPLHLNTGARGWRMKCLFLAQVRQPFEVVGLRPEDSVFMQRLCDIFCYYFDSRPEETVAKGLLTPIA